MVLSGSYNNYHLADSVNIGGGNQPNATGIYLGAYSSLAGLGFFPTNDTEKDLAFGHNGSAMNYDAAYGITCMEIFFYLDTHTIQNPSWGGNSSRFSYLFYTRSEFTDGSNSRTLTQVFFSMNGSNLDLNLTFKVLSPSSTSNNQQRTSKIILTSVNNYLNTGQWYHLVVRLNDQDTNIFENEVLIGNTGKNKDGTSSAVSESILDGDFGTANSDVNNGKYIRITQILENQDNNQVTTYAMFVGRNNPSHSACRLVFGLGTQGNVNSVTNRLARNLIGGIAEFRLWNSTRRNAKSYFELQNNKFEPVVYSADGDYPDLAHCFRFNETGVTSATDYVDVGQYNGIFTDSRSHISDLDPSYPPYETGYPYDIDPFSGDPPGPKYFSGHAAGHADAIDFFGQQFATGVGGVPYYREALPAELGAVPPPNGFEELAQDNTPVRIAVRDYYNGLVYLLPGTGTVQEDLPDAIDTDLGLEGIGLFVRTDVFYPLAGKDVVYSQFYLIENASLTEGLDNINYYASSISGPSIIVVNDSGVGFITESEALGG